MKPGTPITITRLMTRVWKEKVGLPTILEWHTVDLDPVRTGIYIGETTVSDGVIMCYDFNPVEAHRVGVIQINPFDPPAVFPLDSIIEKIQL